MNKGFNNLEIFIERSHFTRTLDIWVMEKGLSSDQNIHYDNESKSLVSTEINHCEVPNEDYKPFLRLPLAFAELFFKALSDYNSNIGKYTDNENLIKGELLATKEHLKDMRDITKKLIDLKK